MLELDLIGGFLGMSAPAAIRKRPRNTFVKREVGHRGLF